jgi:hypothetical protein
MPTWVLGLDSWIIQDGNYSDFVRGQRAEFAVEFVPKSFTSPGLRPSAIYDGNAIYRLTGDVVFALEDSEPAWILDCGLLMYADQMRPVGVEVGDRVSLAAYVGVDHFAYFERLARIPDLPAMIYSLEIERIERQTAPFIEVAPRTFERDAALLGWVETDATRAWEDDNGHAEYVLHCRLLDESPKRWSATAH